MRLPSVVDRLDLVRTENRRIFQVYDGGRLIGRVKSFQDPLSGVASQPGSDYWGFITAEKPDVVREKLMNRQAALIALLNYTQTSN